MNYVFSRHLEYFRLVGVIYLSEEGTYKELPTDLSAAYIQVDAVYYIALVSPSGDIVVQSYANKPAKDKDDNAGGPVVFGGDTLFTEAGAGTLSLTLSRDYNPYLTPDQRSRADEMWASLEAATPRWWE